MSGILNVVQNRFRDPLTTKTLSIANDFTQLKKIQASDAETSDNFGYSVAVSDTRIVVGALYEDTTATDAGSAYIFDIDGNQIAKIQASDAEASDNFGVSVAVSDTRIVVGALFEDTTASGAGSAYIFDIDGNQIAKIQANDAQASVFFGRYVAVSDTRIVVGAPYDDTTATDAGSVYIFDIDGNQLAKIQASDAQESDRFGHSVSVSDNRIVVGAYYEGDANSGTYRAGSAYIFDIDGNQLAKLVASPRTGFDYFGTSVAASNTRIVVGNPNSNTPSPDAGSAYIFDIDGNQLAMIQSSDVQGNDFFGWSVAVSDTRIVVGAKEEDTTAFNAGSAYIFDINGNQLAKIQASDVEQYDNFGWSVAVSDTRIVVGVPYEDTTATDAGSVYIYKNFHNDYDSIPWEKIRLKFTGDIE